MKLLRGNPTGHHDQYQATLIVDDGQMLRGAMSTRALTKLRAALAKGCRMTGVEFESATLTATRRKNASTE